MEKGAIVFTTDPEKMLEAFKSQFKIAEAAGGVVVDPQNRFLLIHRNGVWDLPKGKLEKAETIPEAAIREVEEECGIVWINLGDSLRTTYHTYERNGKDYFKPTYWFMMSIDEEQQGLAQEEEGITEVRWFEREELLKSIPKTFPNIEMVLEEALSRPKP